VPFARATEKEPRLDIHPEDATSRGIVNGERVRVFNDRGSYTLKAAVSDRARPGVVVAPSVWWRKLSPDGRNANDVTSQAIADMGGAATYYDCLVEVERVS
jgi:anaerobic selenocysteine-containing dehydrogenase